MKKSIAAWAVMGSALAAPALAQEADVPDGVRRLNHVFVIMMENHGYGQIIGNPNAAFINQLAQSANLASNYFAIAHPSLTNYLEVVGGSNFGVLSDNPPDWHNAACAGNLASGTANTENPPSPPICPIAGIGSDAATPAIDLVNAAHGPPGEVNIDGTQSIPAASHIVGKTIADQLVEAGRGWKNYQEDLSITGADRVNYSDGVYANNTDFGKIPPPQSPPLSSGAIIQLYAVKHNPFVYFKSVQEGRRPGLSLDRTVGFDGTQGFYADLAKGDVAAFSFIAPNQCNDQHGRGNAGPFCNYDPASNGGQAGLNPALIQRADVTAQKLVTAIKKSPAWSDGDNAIVVLWDENDYSLAPNDNRVALIVDTSYGVHGTRSAMRYNHFSLLKTLEAAFGLPCLNHACDKDVKVMSDLFGADRQAGK